MLSKVSNICFNTSSVDAYASKTRIKISSYWWFYKIKYTVKVEKLKTEFSFLYKGTYIFPEHTLGDALSTARFPNYTSNTFIFLHFASDRCIAIRVATGHLFGPTDSYTKKRNRLPTYTWPSMAVKRLPRAANQRRPTNDDILTHGDCGSHGNWDLRDGLVHKQASTGEKVLGIHLNDRWSRQE